jgi:hypothetical protein
VLQKFYDLLEKSVIISGAIALALTVTTCYLWAKGLTPPDQLVVFMGIVITFFFTQRQMNQIKGK